MLHLPKLFSDGAVLQREKPVKVWGTFEPFSKIKLSLEDSVAEVITDQDGNFKATLKAPKYGFNKQLILRMNQEKRLNLSTYQLATYGFFPVSQTWISCLNMIKIISKMQIK